MLKGVDFEFKLDGATASLRSVLVYPAPLINSLSMLRASALAFASVAISEIYFGIR
jgi:hypothetical protein